MIAIDTPFKILWRTFVEQFAANESATSDMQMRRAIIGVMTFLDHARTVPHDEDDVRLRDDGDGGQA